MQAQSDVRTHVHRTFVSSSPLTITKFRSQKLKSLKSLDKKGTGRKLRTKIQKLLRVLICSDGDLSKTNCVSLLSETVLRNNHQHKIFYFWESSFIAFGLFKPWLVKTQSMPFTGWMAPNAALKRSPPCDDEDDDQQHASPPPPPWLGRTQPTTNELIPDQSGS